MTMASSASIISVVNHSTCVCVLLLSNNMTGTAVLQMIADIFLHRMVRRLLVNSVLEFMFCSAIFSLLSNLPLSSQHTSLLSYILT